MGKHVFLLSQTLNLRSVADSNASEIVYSNTILLLLRGHNRSRFSAMPHFELKCPHSLFGRYIILHHLSETNDGFRILNVCIPFEEIDLDRARLSLSICGIERCKTEHTENPRSNINSTNVINDVF